MTTEQRVRYRVIATWSFAILLGAIALIVSHPAFSQQGMNAPAGGDVAPATAPEKKAVPRKHRANRNDERANAPAVQVQSTMPPPAIIIAPGPVGIGISIGR